MKKKENAYMNNQTIHFNNNLNQMEMIRLELKFYSDFAYRFSRALLIRFVYHLSICLKHFQFIFCFEWRIFLFLLPDCRPACLPGCLVVPQTNKSPGLPAEMYIFFIPGQNQLAFQIARLWVLATAFRLREFLL